MRATVAEKREVAKGTLFVRFAVEDYPDYRPGAYFWVELPNRGHDDEKGLRRHISLATSPTERGVVGLATRLRDTAFKQTLAELEVGDEVQVEEPKGSFLLPKDTDTMAVTMIAANHSNHDTTPVVWPLPNPSRRKVTIPPLDGYVAPSFATT